MIAIYIRNIIFGITDSLTSTVGFLAGVSVGGASREIIILTGLVYTFVEAFSMAAGSFLSEEFAEDYEAQKDLSNRKPLLGGLAMFVSYVLVSFIPILPYVFFEGATAIWISIILSMSALFIAGASVAKLSKIKPLKHGLKMVLLGGSATIIGIIVGKIINIG
ncbi:MAG: VIT1/CCC1 transporter family protein [bacterium]|nr:VIT1/CCC1 transporter family protein [bacterium]